MEVISDAARRAADIINGYVTFMDLDELRQKWIAIKLQDGSHDGTLYDSKRDAVKHQSDEFLCAYISFRNIPLGTNAKDMEIFLRHNRNLYDHGFRLPDPDAKSGGPDVLITTGQADYWNNVMKNEFWAKNAPQWDQLLKAIRNER